MKKILIFLAVAIDIVLIIWLIKYFQIDTNYCILKRDPFKQNLINILYLIFIIVFAYFIYDDIKEFISTSN